MNIEYIIIAVFLVFMFSLLNKYAVRRAKYLMSMELGSSCENVVQYEKVIKTMPIHQPAAPTRATTSLA
jgi:hypothetical protein